MAAAAILNFQTLIFWTPDDTYIARIYKHTKVGANRSRIGRDMLFCVFSKMAAAQLLGSMLPANGVMISLNLLSAP